MTGTLLGLLALAGIASVYIANQLRQRRTGERGCSGHFFVAANSMSTVEWLLNRGGITVFVLGVIGGLIM